MSRVILRTKQNGVFTGVLKTEDAPPGARKGVFVEMDSETGLLLWCPEDQIDEIIPIFPIVPITRWI